MIDKAVEHYFLGPDKGGWLADDVRAELNMVLYPDVICLVIEMMVSCWMHDFGAYRKVAEWN